MQKADQTHIGYLEATYNSHMVRLFLKRFGLTGKIEQSENEGPVFIVPNILEQDFETIQRNIVHMINQTVDASNRLRTYISSKDIKIEKKSNYEELIKRVPELEGIF
jgi:hypothetical protein